MFSHSIVAVITPMFADGKVDYARFEALLEWQIEQGSSAICVLGTTGESPTITPEERAKIITTAAAVIKRRVPMMVGTGTYNTQTTIESTQQALGLGADAALIVSPYYSRPTAAGLQAHFTAVAKTVAIPIMLYNHPGRTGVDLSVDAIVELAKQSNIVAVKDANTDVSRVAALKAQTENFDVLTGCDELAYEWIQQGADGVVSAAANIIPAQMHRLCELSLAKDADARTLNDTLTPLFDALCFESNPIPVKWAAQEMGLTEGGIRLPLLPLSEKYHEPMRKALGHAIPAKAGIQENISREATQ